MHKYELMILHTDRRQREDNVTWKVLILLVDFKLKSNSSWKVALILDPNGV